MQLVFQRATGVALAMAVGWNVFSLVQLFGDYPRWKSTLRALLGFVLFGVASTVLSFALAVAYRAIARA